MNRRAFWQSLAAALSTAGLAATQPDAAASPHQALARILGLRDGEIRWLDDLSAAQQKTLLAGLTAGGRPSRQTVDLLYRLLGRRDRLFPYVGYPPLPNRLTACDGLIRE
jgi:hypothetical protein